MEQAIIALQALTMAHDLSWQLGRSQWNVDQDEGTIIFTTPRGMHVTAPVQIVGSYSTADNSWRWGWDHPSVAPGLDEHARTVRAYGEEKGFDLLTTHRFKCPEEQCWEFAALACKLNSAQGAYRGPHGKTRVFFTFGKVVLSRAS